MSLVEFGSRGVTKFPLVDAIDVIQFPLVGVVDVSGERKPITAPLVGVLDVNGTRPVLLAQLVGALPAVEKVLFLVAHAQGKVTVSANVTFENADQLLLSGVAHAVTNARGEVTLTAALTGSSVATSSSSAAVEVSETGLTGYASAVSSAAAEISRNLLLSGAAAAKSSATASAELGNILVLTGAAIAKSLASGEVSASLDLSGHAGAVSTAVATINIGSGFEARAKAASSASAAVSCSIEISGDAVAHGVSTANIEISAELAAVASSTSSATATLLATLLLSASATSAASAAGTVSMESLLTATSIALSSSTSSVAIASTLTGNAKSTSSATAGVDLSLGMLANANATSVSTSGVDIAVSVSAISNTLSSSTSVAALVARFSGAAGSVSSASSAVTLEALLTASAVSKSVATSGISMTVDSGAPTLTTAPSIAYDSLGGYAGSTYTATPGVWTSGSPTGQWLADGAAITGATTLTWVMTAAYEGRAITYRETNGTTTADSNAVEVWMPTDAATSLVRWRNARDPSTVTIASNAVTAVADKTGLGGALVKGSSGNVVYAPTGLNGMPCLDMSGAYAFLKGSGVASLPTTNQAWTLVLQGLLTASAYSAIYSIGLDRQLGTVGATQLGSPRSGDDRATSIAPSSLGDGVVVAVAAGATPATKITVNGTVGYNSTRNTLSSAVAAEQLGINASSATNKTQEALVYAGMLSDADTQKLAGYLAWAWRRTAALPAAHPYKSAPPRLQ